MNPCLYLHRDAGGDEKQVESEDYQAAQLLARPKYLKKLIYIYSTKILPRKSKLNERLLSKGFNKLPLQFRKWPILTNMKGACLTL